MFGKLFGGSGNKKPAHQKTDITRRFNLIGRVGQGSMSKVWKAVDLLTGKSVAVKVLEKEKTAKFESRFQGLHKPSEGEVALSLNHPNIVRTFEFGWTTDDEMFLVMEFVEGVGLALLVDLQNEEMKRYRLRYMIQIGDALDHFHQQNWIHRDICPRNVMISDEKTAKMIDFGLAVPNTPEFRRPGNRTGTASYMAPELIKRQPTDQRIDIFSYAVTCFEMYTRRFPWDAGLTIDAALQHINKPPIQLTTLVPTVDKQIAAAIMKGLESDPDRRWQSIADMVNEIREAEARLVRAARAAQAARARASGMTPAEELPVRPPALLPSEKEDSESHAPARHSDSALSDSALSDSALSDSARVPSRPPKLDPRTQARTAKKATKSKRRSADDDVDLNEMFGD